MHSPAFTTAAVVCLLALTSEASATLIRYDFTAVNSKVTVRRNAAAWPPLLEGGDKNRTITGYLVVDTSLFLAFPTHASCFCGVVAFDLLSPKLNVQHFVTADTDVNSFYGDTSFFDQLHLGVGLSGAPISAARITLFDEQGTALDAPIPTGALDVSAFEQRHFSLTMSTGAPRGDFKVVHATLTSVAGSVVSVPDVPEPPPLLLLSTTMAALLALRRRRRAR